MSIKVPPDGGWGWMIVIANSLNALSTIPIIQGFGLIFKDSFAALSLTATDTSIIINVNLAFGMLLGLINGPLLKTFGYRKIGLIGSILYATGIILTAFANSFVSIMICYGILASVGMGMSMAGFSLALNTYFTTKRGRAAGLALTLTGLGPIFMPQLASILLPIYGIQKTQTVAISPTVMGAGQSIATWWFCASNISHSTNCSISSSRRGVFAPATPPIVPIAPSFSRRSGFAPATPPTILIVLKFLAAWYFLAGNISNSTDRFNNVPRDVVVLSRQYLRQY